MRIFVGSVQQETNSFSPLRAALADFAPAEGEAMLSKIAATPVFRAAGAELIPSVYGNAVPSGRLEEAVFQALLAKLTAPLRAAGRVDGVWLYLHGALEVEDSDGNAACGGGTYSGDLAILRALRAVTGMDIPYAVAMDFHANHDPAIAEYANVICGYRTAPHADMPQTQEKAARLLLRCLQEGMLPRPVLVSIPAIVPGDMVITAEPPIDRLCARLDEMERDPDLLSISFFNGQNWVDSENNRASCVAVARPGREALARDRAREIARLFWGMRKEFRFRVDALPPKEALLAAMSEAERPMFVSDSGDNTTAGAGGASAGLLAHALALGMRETLFAGIYDPAAQDLCRAAGLGAEVECLIGEEKVPFTGRVRALTTVLGWDGEPAGEAALLSGAGVDVIVTQRRCAFISPEIIASAGADFTRYRCVAVKLGYLYPKLAAVAAGAILAKTPGQSSVDIPSLPFTRLRRPIWPLDEPESEF